MAKVTLENIWFVFAYDRYYPDGGEIDCEIVTDNLEEAENKRNELANKFDYAHICIVRNGDFVPYDEEYTRF